MWKNVPKLKVEIRETETLCPYCQGSGHSAHTYEDKFGLHFIPCIYCNGTGRYKTAIFIANRAHDGAAE